VSGVSRRTCRGAGAFLDQSRKRGSQHRHIDYIAQYIVTWLYKDARRAGLATFRYHFTALYRDKRLNPNSTQTPHLVESKQKHRRRRKVTALNQPRSRQLVLDVRVVDRSRDEAPKVNLVWHRSENPPLAAGVSNESNFVGLE